ncbi:MAG TPA: hypothetical protein VMD27_13610 [Candidatus Aquilonibacter sp.]|nr:hypothetical protein [Candidatus Aquilonibacter sp.]
MEALKKFLKPLQELLEPFKKFLERFKKLLEPFQKFLEVFQKFSEPLKKLPETPEKPLPTLRGLIGRRRHTPANRAVPGLRLDKLVERRRESGHRPDATIFRPAKLLAGRAMLLDCACIYGEHPTKLIPREPCKHICTPGKLPAAGRAIAPPAHRTGLMTDHTPGRPAR